jgi:hypothetical protein
MPANDFMERQMFGVPLLFYILGQKKYYGH